jgi:hypothetical protein
VSTADKNLGVKSSNLRYRLCQIKDPLTPCTGCETPTTNKQQKPNPKPKNKFIALSPFTTTSGWGYSTTTIRKTKRQTT